MFGNKNCVDFLKKKFASDFLSNPRSQESIFWSWAQVSSSSCHGLPFFPSQKSSKKRKESWRKNSSLNIKVGTFTMKWCFIFSSVLSSMFTCNDFQIKKNAWCIKSYKISASFAFQTCFLIYRENFIFQGMTTF